MKVALKNFYDNLRPGRRLLRDDDNPSVLYSHSKEAPDGMRLVSYDSPRIGKWEYYMNFTHSEDKMIEKFSMFEPAHVGFYAERYRQDEGERHHFTFVGVKR